MDPTILPLHATRRVFLVWHIIDTYLHQSHTSKFIRISEEKNDSAGKMKVKREQLPSSYYILAFSKSLIVNEQTTAVYLGN